MLREGNVKSLHWADKTMSILRERQMEASLSRLSACPAKGLFSGCDDVMVEDLWRHTYDALENPVLTSLHTTRGLQRLVTARLAAEAALLSIEEHELLERVIVLGGKAELFNDEVTVAESLVRRMWCTFDVTDGRLCLLLPETLLVPLSNMLLTPTHLEIRAKLEQFDNFINWLLHLTGFLHYREPLRYLLRHVVAGTYADQETIALRYLRIAFDYIYDEHGEMILLHPGLAEPERLLKPRRGVSLPMPDPRMFPANFEPGSLLPEEIPVYERLIGLLAGAVRPELTEDMAVRDLIMLAKQGVSFEESAEVLSSLLTILPTAAMLDGLRMLHAHTPRWCSLTTALEQ